MLAVAWLILGVAQSAPTPAQDKAREALIWDAVYSRMTTQNDKWFKAGDFPRCLQQLKFVYEFDPHDYESASDLAWMLENVHEWDEAKAVYARYQKENPNDPDRGLPQAQSAFNQREYAKAAQILEPMLSDKAHPNVFRVLAHSYSKLGRYKDSLRVWDRYVKLYPADDAGKRNRDKVKRLADGAGA
ncbi:MAG: tetratricopeptide repeat protein [Fimbriimonadaceae bacterium]|nr:tetratricopeptide repeat protein [Fimbriimonadaceae bacterium]